MLLHESGPIPRGGRRRTTRGMGRRAAHRTGPIAGLGALALLALVAGCGADRPGAGDDPPGIRVAALFDDFDSMDAPGASVAVYRDGDLLYSDGFGSAQLEYRVPITPETVFHVASVSKQFTAFAAVLLAERGDISLDDDIRDYIPEVPDFGPTITVRHLIHHTSGLRDQWSLLVLAGWRIDDVITKHDILRLVSMQRELNFPPGSEYTYSNTGYTLLAEMVSRVTGRPFPDWMRDHVFEPLGMEDTHFHDDHEMIVPDRAYSYEVTPDGPINLVLSYANVGATSLFTTAEDLTKWAGNFFAPRVGTPATIRQLSERGVLTSGDTITYAFGLGVGTFHELPVLEHGGGDAGFRSFLLMIPEKRFAVSVLSNAARMDTGEMAYGAAEIFLADDLPAGAAASDDASPEAVDVPRTELERAAGRYWQPELGAIRTIRLAGDRLIYDRGSSEETLVPLGEGRFRMEGVVPPVYVSFAGGEEKALRMRIEGEAQRPIVAGRIEEGSWRTPLPAFAGRFHSPELDATYEIRVEDEGLVLYHWRHGDVPLEERVTDMTFTSGAWWLGALTFETEPDGRVTGFRATSGRIRNLAFARVP